MPDSAISAAYARARKGDIFLQAMMTRMYAEAMESVLVEQRKLANYVQSQAAKGAPVSPSWLSRDARYLSLQSQFYQALSSFGADAIQRLSIAMPGVVDGALSQTRREVLEAATGGTGGIVPPGYGPETWAVVNKQALAAANAFINDVKSPLYQLLARDLPESALAEFRKQWQSGLATGKNPNQIARNIARRMQQLALSRAQLIARTEFHRAYREGKREQFESSQVVEGWTWRSATDRRTCAVCWGMHGTVHPKTEILDGHPNCRCVMVPLTKSPRELGLEGLKDTAVRLPKGEDLFARLPPDQQLRILGPGRFKLYNEGRSLASFIGQRNSPLWGSQRTLEPLGRAPRAKTGGGGDDFDDYMLRTHGVKFEGSALTTVEQNIMRKALDDLSAILGVNLKTIGTGFRNTGLPSLGEHKLVSGALTPAHYKVADNIIEISQHGRVVGQFGDWGNAEFRRVILHEFAHAIHHSQYMAARLAEWRAIHLGTGGAATLAMVTKQLNSSIQLRAKAQRDWQKWKDRIDSGYDLSLDYMRRQMELQAELARRYTQQIDALREAKKNLKANDDAFVRDYSKNNEWEDFADSIMKYIDDPVWMQRNAPNRYGFISKYFG